MPENWNWRRRRERSRRERERSRREREREERAMSSHAAVGSDGYYYPPDYDGRKHGGINTYRGSHGALGKRAKKLKSEGKLVVRFEMPFNVTCSGLVRGKRCGETIAKGVRFNAEKQQQGSYYTSKIWLFTMTAPCCKQKIEIRTDPKTTDFVVVSGAERKASAVGADGVQVLDLVDESERGSNHVDPFEQLEKNERQKVAATSSHKQIRDLQSWSAATRLDNYEINKKLRSENRGKRKRDKRMEEEGKALGLSIKLEEERPEDRREASLAFLQRPATASKVTTREKRRAIMRESIFKGASTSAGANAARSAKSHQLRKTQTE